MPIIYSLVARGATVLAEHAAATGNFITVSRLILDKIADTQGGKMSYTYDRCTIIRIRKPWENPPFLMNIFLLCLQRHFFHYAANDGLIYLCMSDEQFPRRIAFAFLEDIRTRFLGMYRNTYKTAMAFGMNEEFSRVLQRQMVAPPPQKKCLLKDYQFLLIQIVPIPPECRSTTLMILV